MLIGKAKLNAINFFISKALIVLHISHGDFVSINNVLGEYNEIKKEIKNPEISVEYTNKYVGISRKKKWCTNNSRY